MRTTMKQACTEKRRAAWLALLVAVAAFALYSPSIGYDTVALDDDAFVVNNLLVKDGFSVASLKGSFTTAPENYWAPLLWGSYALDVELFGMEPWGFHLTNVVLFALNAGLLFALLFRWTSRWGIALAATLLWAFHPLRVESVAWITERKDVLSGLFFLLGIGAYVEGRRGTLRNGVALAWVCMALGGMAKQILVVMPLALVLLDVWPLGRTDWDRIWRDGWRLAAEKWAFWVLALALASLPVWLHHDRGGMIAVSFANRLSMIPAHYLFYLRKLVWPAGLMPLQADLPYRGWVSASGLGLLVAATWGLWRVRKGAPWALMGWLWLVGLLFPLSGVVWAGQERLACRFLYIPQIGLTLAAALAVDGFVRQRGWSRRWAVLACAGVLAAYVWQTLRILQHWRDKGTFIQAVWTYNSGHETACLMGGNWFMTQGDWQQAEQAYGRGTLKGNKKCVTQLCQLWIWCGRTDAAENMRRAFENTMKSPLLEFKPEDMPLDRICLWSNHGQLLLAAGDAEGAVAALGEAVALEKDPAAFVVAEYLRACHEAGRPEAGADAAARLKAAQGIDVREWRDLLPRYLQFWQEGGRGLAYGYFAEYARRFPEDGLALNNMAWLLATAEPDGLVHARMDEWAAISVAWAERAVELGGGEIAGAWSTLAAARANAGDFEGALAAIERGLALAQGSGDWVLVSRLKESREGYRVGMPMRVADERAKMAGNP